MQEWWDSFSALSRIGRIRRMGRTGQRGWIPPQPGCDQTWTRSCCGASTRAWWCLRGGASVFPGRCGRSSCHPLTPALERPHQTTLESGTGRGRWWDDEGREGSRLEERNQPAVGKENPTTAATAAAAARDKKGTTSQAKDKQCRALRLEWSPSPGSRKILDFSWDFLAMSMAMFRSSIHLPISTLELRRDKHRQSGQAEVRTKTSEISCQQPLSSSLT